MQFNQSPCCDTSVKPIVTRRLRPTNPRDMDRHQYRYAQICQNSPEDLVDAILSGKVIIVNCDAYDETRFGIPGFLPMRESSPQQISIMTRSMRAKDRGMSFLGDLSAAAPVGRWAPPVTTGPRLPVPMVVSSSLILSG